MNYELVFPIFGIIFGILVILFRKKMVKDQQDFSSRRKGFIFSKVAKYPGKDYEIVALVSGIGIIIISIAQLISIQ